MPVAISPYNLRISSYIFDLATDRIVHAEVEKPSSLLSARTRVRAGTAFGSVLETFQDIGRSLIAANIPEGRLDSMQRFPGRRQRATKLDLESVTTELTFFEPSPCARGGVDGRPWGSTLTYEAVDVIWRIVWVVDEGGQRREHRQFTC